MTNKIVALSKYGFKLDSMKNDWVSVDKSLLNQDLFKSLKKGDIILITGRNKEGFVTEFELKNPDFNGVVNNLVKSLSKNVSKQIDNAKREHLKSLCLQASFNACFHNRDIGFEKSREDAIRFAQKLFDELEAADYYNW